MFSFKFFYAKCNRFKIKKIVGLVKQIDHMMFISFWLSSFSFSPILRELATIIAPNLKSVYASQLYRTWNKTVQSGV